MSVRFLLVLAGIFLSLTASGWARDVFVLLSGGASPASNNYSQYLQAKAVAKFFGDNYPADSVWTFFGAGNVEGEPAFFGDVRRQVRQDGWLVESWLPGALPRNRPAKRDEVLRAFREEILPAVRDGGTLFLFVGDHGSQTRGADRESVIDLWGIDHAPETERGWKAVNSEKLPVSELRKLLAEGLGRGRVVFCMTQCHSGGFHFLGIPREVAPNPEWFTRFVPEWAMPVEPAVSPAVAGYAATDAASLAAGCDPDPDPDKWAGYERFVPENLLGLDLFTLEPAGVRRGSFHEAHVEATLVDQTIDKPYATSEQYLERWANLIENRLVPEAANLAPRVQRALQAYTRAVDTGEPRGRDRAFREREELFGRFTEQMTKQNVGARDLLLKGSRRDLERAIGTAASRPATPTAQSAPAARETQKEPAKAAPKQGNRNSERRTAWRETIRPAWKKAVESGAIDGLAGEALEFERHLLAQEERGRNFFFQSGGQNPLINEVFWNSGYHDPRTLDRTKAEAIARWAAERRSRIGDWARGSSDEHVRAAAERAFPMRRGTSAPPAVRNDARPRDGAATRANVSTRPLSRRTAAERALFYRRTLAAWAFLLAVEESPALERIGELTALERTPLPRS